MDNDSSRHEINEEVLRLIKQSIEDMKGSHAAFCRITGISKSTLSKILSGSKKYVYGDIWNRIYDFIPEIESRRRPKRKKEEAKEVTDGVKLEIDKIYVKLTPGERIQVLSFMTDLAHSKNQRVGGIAYEHKNLA